MKKRIIALIILTLLLSLFLSGTVLAVPKLQDVYEAYGLQKGDKEIAGEIHENPPDFIALQPIRVRWMDIDMPVNIETLMIEKGKEAKFKLSAQGSKDTVSVSIVSDITFKYGQTKDPRILFEIEQSTHLQSYTNGKLVRDETSKKTSVAGGFGGHAAGNLDLTIFLAKESGAGNVGEVSFRFVGVQVKKGGLGIFETNTQASETAGETSVPVATAIILGLAGVAAAAVGAGGGAGAIGAATGSNSGETEEASGNTYKMVIYKDFADKIKYDDQAVYIYARMVEVNSEGAEIERLDLTEKIEIFSNDSFLEIGLGTLVGSYMGASVQASATCSNMPSEGIISFRFAGEGGSFQNNVKFKMIGEAYIALDGPKLFVLATSGQSFQLPYELKDFFAEAEVSVKAWQDSHPFELAIGQDKAGKPIIIATDRGEKRPFEHFYESFNCEIIAQNEKEYARTCFNVVMCYEGLAPDFLGKPKEIRGYKKEDGEMEETLIAFKLGLWNQSSNTLDFVKPVGLEIECSDEKGVFQVIGIEYEEDLNRVRADAVYYIFQAKISLPAKEPIPGKLTIATDHNGTRYENEIDINLIPDLLKFEADYEKEYQNCLYIINTYLPARFHEKKLQELAKAKATVDIKDLRLFREKVWQIASRAIMEEKEHYLIDSYWWDEAIATAELVVAVGDIAFDVVLSSVGGPLAGFAAGQVKGAFLDFVALYVEKPSIGMPELQEFLEKRFVQMVGQADGAFNMPEPSEKKKLAAWLACFTVYRILYHKWFDTDEQNQPIGYLEAVKRGINDLAGKGLSAMLSGYIKETTFKTGKVADFAKGDQKLYDDTVQKATDTLTDFVDRIKNGGIQFT